MERYADLFKRHVLHFKLELCCFMATVRSGLMALACINIAIGVMTLMFFAEESFEPLLLKALSGIAEDPPNYGPSLMIVYSIELGSNVLLLCGIIRNDLVLLRVYLYFTLGVLTAAVMVYSVMFSVQSLTVKCLIIASIGYQIYIILLVRSAMVEINQASKKNDYTVNFRQSSVRYSRPGSKDKYSVVIEPHRPRGSLVPLVVKETNPKTIKEVVKKEPVKKPAVTVHLPAKEGGTKEVVVKETVKEGATNEGVTKKEPAKKGAAKKEAVKKVVAKEGDVTESTAKDGQEEVAKDKEKEPKKRKRSFFGRKQKAKEDESPATNDV